MNTFGMSIRLGKLCSKTSSSGLLKYSKSCNRIPWPLTVIKAHLIQYSSLRDAMRWDAVACVYIILQEKITARMIIMQENVSGFMQESDLNGGKRELLGESLIARTILLFL